MQAPAAVICCRCHPGVAEPQPVGVKPGPAAAVRAGLIYQAEGDAVAGDGQWADRDIAEPSFIELAR
jgi:hypothetical protein